jgi:NAD(P)-dependent dehydrogenase (short-subunit alcohol dehydrogenase family)
MANVKKVALITGANKGLGFEMAMQLARKGITVMLAARDREKGEAAAEKLRGEGLDVQFLKLDVVNPEDYAPAAAALETRLRRTSLHPWR